MPNLGLVVAPEVGPGPPENHFWAVFQPHQPPYSPRSQPSTKHTLRSLAHWLTVEDWPCYGAKGPWSPKYCSEVLHCEDAMRSKHVKIVKQLENYDLQILTFLPLKVFFFLFLCSLLANATSAVLLSPGIFVAF